MPKPIIKLEKPCCMIVMAVSSKKNGAFSQPCDVIGYGPESHSRVHDQIPISPLDMPNIATPAFTDLCLTYS